MTTLLRAVPPARTDDDIIDAIVDYLRSCGTMSWRHAGRDRHQAADRDLWREDREKGGRALRGRVAARAAAARTAGAAGARTTMIFGLTRG